jgi:hypothetical protein
MFESHPPPTNMGTEHNEHKWESIHVLFVNGMEQMGFFLKKFVHPKKNNNNWNHLKD